MRLENYYYRILGAPLPSGADTATFRIALQPDSAIYRGHFPGHPVCPGVCHIQMARECAERLVGHGLRLVSIARCQFKTMATPAACAEMDLTVGLQPTATGYAVTARLIDPSAGTAPLNIYMELRGEVEKEPKAPANV